MPTLGTYERRKSRGIDRSGYVFSSRSVHGAVATDSAIWSMRMEEFNTVWSPALSRIGQLSVVVPSPCARDPIQQSIRDYQWRADGSNVMRHSVQVR